VSTELSNVKSRHLQQSFVAFISNIMATGTVTLNTESTETPEQSQYPREPLKLKGVLDQYKSFDVTPIIGREFVDVNLKDWLEAPNADELIRDLAITSTLTKLLRV
jgi:hypothetical protein